MKHEVRSLALFSDRSRPGRSLFLAGRRGSQSGRGSWRRSSSSSSSLLSSSSQWEVVCRVGQQFVVCFLFVLFPFVVGRFLLCLVVGSFALLLCFAVSLFRLIVFTVPFRDNSSSGVVAVVVVVV